jgi:sodium-dependent dicarboxylate transporter 2/3/5
VTFSTEITSNTALTSIAIPVFYEFTTLNNLDPSIILMTATIAASYAFMLPIATPPNAIAMSYKVVHIKDMAKIGFVINLLAVVILTLFANFYWRLF